MISHMSFYIQSILTATDSSSLIKNAGAMARRRVNLAFNMTCVEVKNREFRSAMQYTSMEKNEKPYWPHERNGPASKRHDITKIIHLCLVRRITALHGLKIFC
jgi:formylglycine-generating enzyme required for sulfatase activity